MKVVVYPTDRYACGHYRMIWPAEALAAQGMDVTVVYPGETTGIGALVLDGRVQHVLAPECDLIVLQRPARKIVADVVPALRARGTAVVVDMDDDLAHIHPSNPAFYGMHPRHSPEYNWEHARRACREATLVTVSTPALLPRYCSHGRAKVIYNYVPAWMTQVEHDPDTDSVGWAGSLHSHPDDLDGVAGTMARLVSEGHLLKFVGPMEGLERKLGVDYFNLDCTGELELEEWVPAIAQRIGVGVAPLADTSFNTAKSWLKPLEYSAAGVPWVASDIVEYRRLARICGAPLVTKPRQWYAALKTLLTDRARRIEASQQVREIAKTLTIEKHVHLWADVWMEAVRLERSRVRV